MAKTKRQIRAEIIEQLEVSEQIVIQKRPNTAIELRARHNGVGKLYIGCGFSKVCWPDSWDEEHGFDLAEYRAKKDIANQIMKEQGV